MKTKKIKSIQHYMRSLHRDIGFFVIGITILYGISGIVLIYRDTEFLKSEKQIEKKLSPNMENEELERALHMRNFEVQKTDGEMVYFNKGSYNKSTGTVLYTTKSLPAFIDKFNNLHKASSKSTVHWFSTIFGILLLFLAISSFWMFKPQTKMFRRGILFAGIGVVFTIILLFL